MNRLLQQLAEHPKGVIVRPGGDGDISPFIFKGKTPKLEEMHFIVGGYIEAVYPRRETEYMIIANEEGCYQGLPVNFVATEFNNDLSWPIVGSVIILRKDLFV